MQRYPTPTSLMDMYNDLKKSEDEKAELLQNMFGPNRESKLSKLLYYFSTTKANTRLLAPHEQTQSRMKYGEIVKMFPGIICKVAGREGKGV